MSAARSQSAAQRHSALHSNAQGSTTAQSKMFALVRVACQRARPLCAPTLRAHICRRLPTGFLQKVVAKETFAPTLSQTVSRLLSNDFFQTFLLNSSLIQSRAIRTLFQLGITDRQPKRAAFVRPSRADCPATSALHVAHFPFWPAP